MKLNSRENQGTLPPAKLNSRKKNVFSQLQNKILAKISTLKVIESTNNYVISKSLMENGEFSIFKSFKASSSLTASERLNRLSFEAKILTYIGFQ